MATICQITFSTDEKCVNLYNNFTEVCSQWLNQKHSNIVSDNGLAPTRRQAINWNNSIKFTGPYMSWGKLTLMGFSLIMNWLTFVFSVI